MNRRKAADAQKVIEAEKMRQDAKKYSPNPDAIKKWINFRSHPDKYKGTITTWEIKTWGGDIVFDFDSSNVKYYRGFVWLNGSPHYKVEFRWPKDQLRGDNFIKEDWLIFTGKFVDSDVDNWVVMDTILIKNEGYDRSNVH